MQDARNIFGLQISVIYNTIIFFALVCIRKAEQISNMFEQQIDYQQFKETDRD